MEKKIVILSETGLHARPASFFVSEVIAADADVKIIKDGKEFDGKSVMSILSMGAIKGTELILKVSGNDEELLEKLSSILDDRA